MLGPLTPDSDRQTALGISLQARIWWYKSRLDVEIDRAAYENHLKENSPSSASCPDPALLAQVQEIQQRMAAASSVPAWQLQAPKVDPSQKAEDGSPSHASDGDAPYPAHFQAIVEAVTLGKPVPGVREIPNTVVRQPVSSSLTYTALRKLTAVPKGITPVGKMQPPKKPWERNQDGISATTASELLNQEFPPVLDDTTTA